MFPEHGERAKRAKRFVESRRNAFESVDQFQRCRINRPLKIRLKAKKEEKREREGEREEK